MYTLDALACEKGFLGFSITVCIYFGYSCVCACGYTSVFYHSTFCIWIVNKLNYPGPNCITFTEIIDVFSNENIRKGFWVFLIFKKCWFALNPLFRNSSIVVFYNRLILYACKEIELFISWILNLQIPDSAFFSQRCSVNLRSIEHKWSKWQI